jgi:hypothetical protein
MEQVVNGKKYRISKYENKDAFVDYGDGSKYNYPDEYKKGWPKELSLSEMINNCVSLGCSGFSRSSLHQNKGKYYIRPPDKTPEILREKLIDRLYITFFIVELI